MWILCSRALPLCQRAKMLGEQCPSARKMNKRSKNERDEGKALPHLRRNRLHLAVYNNSVLDDRGAALDQSAFSEITQIAARRSFDKIDGEFQQADFPRVIDALDDGAERFIRALDAMSRAIDH